MHSYGTLFTASTPIFILIGVGVLIRRLGWMSRDTDQELVKILIWLLMPSLVLDRMLGNPVLKDTTNLFLAPLAGMGFLCLGFAVSRLATCAWKASVEERRTFAFAAGTYNYGYIALPLVIELFDDAAVGVMFLHNLGFEVGLWTVGLMVMRGQFSSKGLLLGLNPMVLSILAAVGLTLTGLDALVPRFALHAFTMMGNTAIPVALLITGALIYDYLEPKSFVQKPGVGVMACILRLAILPCMFLFAAAHLPFSLELKQVMIVQAAMPTAVLPIVLTRKYGGRITVAVEAVVATALLSMFTIPLWIQAGERFVLP